LSAARAAVIGGGLSGALQALHLLREGAGRVALIERARTPGRGVAYGTDRPEHLLNVPARRMSAFPDDPDHFVRWFAGRHGGGAEDYAPRMLFGDYMEELLAAAGGGLEIVRGEAVDVTEGEVVLADGRRIESAAMVLAPGNLRPAVPAGIDPGALGPLWIGDPWSLSLGEGLSEDGAVLLIGTGLTAIDAALTLDASGWRGRIRAMSRRGLAPRAHAAREPMAPPTGPQPADALALLRRFRARAAEIGWRSAVHELRTATQEIWSAAPLDQRRRFLRHLRAWWDVHRHRIAPAVAERIAAMEREGRLCVFAGRLVSAVPDGDAATVRVRRRGKAQVETLRASRVVNCTGPELDIVRSGEPLFSALLAAGRIRPDPCRLGIDVDGESRATGADGAPSATLYAIGPVTRGAFWESIAVPDIAVQAQRVARHILAGPG
jgi:uncharacterized NAD(P)/FAD-binding protein YdhS